MNRCRMIMLVGFILLLPSCEIHLVSSIGPIYTSKDQTFETALLGTWVFRDASEGKLTFSKEGDKSYKLHYTDEKGETSIFIANLCTVDGYVIMDIFPLELNEKFPIAYKIHFVPVHSFMLVELKKDKLFLHMTNYDFVQNNIIKNPATIGHVSTKDQIILTGSPTDIQKFLVGNIKEVFIKQDEKDALIKESTRK